MINKVILVGNLGQDPEIRTTNSGIAVGTLRIATTHSVKDRDGKWSDQTEWHSCTVFGKTAENAGKYLTKGRQVYIEGRLQTRKWEKDGQTRYSTEVVVDVLKFLGKKDEGSGGGASSGGGYGGGRGYGGGSGGYQGNNQTGSGGDIPFEA